MSYVIYVTHFLLCYVLEANLLAFYNKNIKNPFLRKVLLSEYFTLLILSLLVCKHPAILIINIVIPYQGLFLIKAKTPVSMKLEKQVILLD